MKLSLASKLKKKWDSGISTMGSYAPPPWCNRWILHFSYSHAHVCNHQKKYIQERRLKFPQ
jgi:hypothetical protein